MIHIVLGLKNRFGEMLFRASSNFTMTSLLICKNTFKLYLNKRKINNIKYFSRLHNPYNFDRIVKLLIILLIIEMFCKTEGD